MRDVLLRWPALAVGPLLALACSHDWTVRPKAAELTDAATDGPTDGNGEGGIANAPFTELATGEERAAELVVAGDSLVWAIAEPSSGRIRACEVANCKPRSLATAQDVPHSLIVEGPHALWLVAREIRRTGLLDGAPVSVVESIDKPLQAVRRIGEVLWASDPDTVARCDYDETSATCTGRATIGFGTVDPPLGPLALDPHQRLWVANRDGVYWVDLDAARIRPWGSADRARTLVAGDATVFALTEAGDVVAVPTAGIDGGTARSIRGEGTASAIAIDTTHLFVGYTDGRVDRHALSAIDRPETIATSLGEVKAMAVARDQIFVALVDGRIGVLPKPPSTP